MSPKCCSISAGQSLDVQIVLHDRSTTYTTNDVVKGVAKISSSVDVRFDQIEIELVGTARTYNDCNVTAIAASGRSEASHEFLKLSHPGLHHRYPTNLVLEADETYDFPFAFAIPEKLHPHTCQHITANDTAHKCHLQLPPSLGRDGSKKLDDMTPQMASVQYETVVRVTKLINQSDGVYSRVIASKSQNLRIVPAIHEQPPMDLGTQASEYLMRAEKSIKKNVFKGKLGTLVVEATQPEALSLPTTEDMESGMTTVAAVTLRFDPIDSTCQPPKIGHLSAKLQATTRYATNVRTALPTHDGKSTDLSQGAYHEHLSLPTRSPFNVDWVRHESFYIARLLVPITLPSTKTYLPTFHSCLITRVYSMLLDLNIYTASKRTVMKLRVPILISSGELAGDNSRGLEPSSTPPAYCRATWTPDLKDMPPHYYDIIRVVKDVKQLSLAHQ